jgi:hypothetical protein
MILKDLLERASYICVTLKNYKEASEHQLKLVKLCEKLYLREENHNRLPHPLLAFHYYTLGKLLSSIGEKEDCVLYL